MSRVAEPFCVLEVEAVVDRLTLPGAGEQPESHTLQFCFHGILTSGFFDKLVTGQRHSTEDF